MKLAGIGNFIRFIYLSYSYIMSCMLLLLCVGYIMMINWKNCSPRSETKQYASYIAFLSLLVYRLILTYTKPLHTVCYYISAFCRALKCYQYIIWDTELTNWPSEWLRHWVKPMFYTGVKFCALRYGMRLFEGKILKRFF